MKKPKAAKKAVTKESKTKKPTAAVEPKTELAKTAAGTEVTVQKLNKDEQKIFAEALRRGEDTRSAVEDTLKDYGQWLFANVFGGDAKAVLEFSKDNPIWMHLILRAGGKTLRIDPRLLNATLMCAAYDKRLNDDTWKALDFTRKSALLPLKNETQMRRAAQHVLNAGLTVRDTRKYVGQMLEDKGEPRGVRVSPVKMKAQVAELRERWTGKDFQRQLAEAVAHLERNDRTQFSKELKSLRDALTALVARL